MPKARPVHAPAALTGHRGQMRAGGPPHIYREDLDTPLHTAAITGEYRSLHVVRFRRAGAARRLFARHLQQHIDMFESRRAGILARR